MESEPYPNWPLLLNNPKYSTLYRERALGAMLFSTTVAAFSLPLFVHSYQKRKSHLALLALIFGITTFLGFVATTLFSFKSRIVPFAAMVHNLSEISFLCLAVSSGIMRPWHLVLIGTIGFLSLSVWMFLSDSALIFAYGTFSLVFDILVAGNWVLISWENRRNVGSSGQRSGLYLLAFGTCFHLLGAILFALPVKGDIHFYFEMLVFPLTLAISMHTMALGVGIIDRDTYDMKWTVVWWKWILIVLSIFLIPVPALIKNQFG